MKKLIISLILLTLIAFAGTAFAAADTEDIQVAASIAASCNISSVANVSFAAYDPTSATPKDAAGNMVFSCVKGTSHKTFMTGTRTATGAVSSDDLTFELCADSSPFPCDNAIPGASSTGIILVLPKRNLKVQS